MPAVSIADDARRRVDRHLGEDTRVELGGVLAGRVDEASVTVLAAVPARSAVGTARSFTFTDDAWTEVNQTLRTTYPDLVPVGWYHSHPGLGIHLSDHDRYICSTFFPEPWQVAYVVDPVRGERGVYGKTGSELVMSEQLPEERRPALTRRRMVAGGVGLIALLLFLLGYFVHSSSPGSSVSFTASFNGGALVMDSTVSEHGSTVQLREVFRDRGKGAVKGTLTPCLPSGAVLDSFAHLQIVAPDGCLLDLTPGHTATITGKGPAATVLSGTGPNDFQSAAKS